MTLDLFASVDAAHESEAAPARVAFVVKGPPVPCERARFGKNGHVFTPERTRAFQKLVGQLARAARPRGWPLDAQYTLRLVVFFPDKRRRDLSNVLKSIEDGCNGILWDDDCAVKRIYVDGRIDRTAPRVEVLVVTR